MKSFLLSGIAIASVLMIQPVPASAQRVHGTGHTHIGHGHAGRWHGGYAHGYGPGYGIGAGAAAVATGALIGGAIATQNQGYYYPNQGYYYPAQPSPGYSDPGYVSGYSDPGYVYSEAPPAAYNNGDSSVAYCEQTYRSYNPATGSYLGYDGHRYACP
jgi:hypothetical protein